MNFKSTTHTFRGLQFADYSGTYIMGPFIHSMHTVSLCAPEAPLKTRAPEKQSTVLVPQGKGFGRELGAGPKDVSGMPQ